MAQLKMYRLPGTELKEYELPEGYSFSNYKDESDIDAWVACCKNGLIRDDGDETDFHNAISKNPDINPYEDVFFLDYNGEHIGTVTAFVVKKGNYGDMHMVAIRNDYRGRGLAKYLTQVTVSKLSRQGVKYIALTTDEWRKGAVKSYLSGGFLPVKYDKGMKKRWEDVLETYKIDSVQMLNNRAKPYKIIYRTGLKK